MTWETDFAKVLSRVIGRKESEVFKEPVQYIELNIPDYPDIVKQPMDLGTLKGKLENGEYKTYADAAYDMRLIWYNSMLYNTPGSKIYSYAKIMSEYWESQCAIHFPSDPDRLPNNEAMSQWVQQCHRLSSEELGKILKMIDEAQPDCLFKRVETNDVEVNVDLISGKLFKHLHEWTENVLPSELLQIRRKVPVISSAANSSSGGV